MEPLAFAVMAASSEPSAEKAAWRTELRTRLASLDPATARRAALRITERTLTLPELVVAEGILSCLSFGSEVDTDGLLEALLAEGRRLFVPRVARGDDVLHVHPYPCRLETLSFGLRQPRVGEPELAPDEIDATIGAALVLGLGFDRRGYRLGYGRGYFDRFLAGRSLPAIGLAYDLQLVDRLPVEAHDVPMRVVVTERRVCRPVARARNAHRAEP